MSERARVRFDELRATPAPLGDAELDAFWASLTPATLDFMLGSWRGGEFVTGHAANGQLAKGRWHGKRFDGYDDVKPLICLDDAGQKFSNTEWMKGEASLWLEEFRGEQTATMVYDGVPIHDHFKEIDENTAMGIMNGKAALDTRTGAGRHLYFWLERE